MRILESVDIEADASPAGSCGRWLDGARDELVRAALHDLRNHLGVIQGWAHLAAMSGGDPGSLATAAESLVRSVRAQAELLDDLDDALSGPTADAAPGTADLTAAARAGIAACAEAFAAREVRLEARLDERPRPVAASRARLDRLVRRALQHAARNCPRREAVAVALEDSGGVARLRVSDPGAAPADGGTRSPERLRRHGVAERSDGRTLVLDLALIRATAERIGARVAVEPGLSGAGVCVAVEIPLVSTGSASGAAGASGR
jgi:hypothetical protein